MSEASQHKQLFVCLRPSTPLITCTFLPLCVHVSDDDEEGGGVGGAARPAASGSSFKGLTHSHNKGAGAGRPCVREWGRKGRKGRTAPSSPALDSFIGEAVYNLDA